MLLTLLPQQARCCALDVLFTGRELASRLPLFLRIFHFFGSQLLFVNLSNASTGDDTDTSLRAFSTNCGVGLRPTPTPVPVLNRTPGNSTQPQQRASFPLPFPGSLDFPLFWLPGWCFPVFPKHGLADAALRVHDELYPYGCFLPAAPAGTCSRSQQNNRGAPLVTHDPCNCKSVGFP